MIKIVPHFYHFFHQGMVSMSHSLEYIGQWHSSINRYGCVDVAYAPRLGFERPEVSVFIPENSILWDSVNTLSEAPEDARRGRGAKTVWFPLPLALSDSPSAAMGISHGAYPNPGGPTGAEDTPLNPVTPTDLRQLRKVVVLSHDISGSFVIQQYKSETGCRWVN